MRIMKPVDCLDYLYETYGLSMSLATFYRRVKEAGVRKYRVPGGMGFSERDLDEYIEGLRS